MALLRRVRHPRRGLTRRIRSPARTGTKSTRRRSLRPALQAAVALPLLLGGACGGAGEDGAVDSHQELRQSLNLDASREIHRITLGGRGGDEHVAPARVRVEPPAVVEFVTVDGRIHTVSFPEDSLALDAALFLRRTAQLESPPLVERGSRFVLTFEDAPAGRYRFRSEGPGGEAWGVILVGGPADAPGDP